MAGLQWIRLDTGFPLNVKIAGLVDTNQHRVIVGHVSMMCHVGLTGTDGYFPEGAERCHQLYGAEWEYWGPGQCRMIREETRPW